MNDQTGSKVQIGGKDMGVMYLRGATLYINDGNSDYINNGNTIIGNNWGSGYTAIESNRINIGQFLTGAGYIDIGGAANTTTGYIVLGSINLDTNYIRGKNININTDGTGNVNLCNGTGTINIYSPLKVGYTPSKITDLMQIGWNSPQSYYNVNVPYSGGDRSYAWWRVQPGVYIATYTSFTKIATNFKKSLFYTSDAAPIYGALVTNVVSYIESGNDEWPNGFGAYNKTTGTSIISVNNYMYIAFLQNIFATNSPTSDIGYGINIVRIA